MPKIQWNYFVSTHKDAHGFSAAVSAALPKGPHFDKGGKQLPTPYALFLEWAAANLSGDWSAVKASGGFMICVADPADAKAVRTAFGTVGYVKRTLACSKTQQIGYSDGGYAKLAKRLGYEL